jgi:hypothetical protein
MLRGQVVSHFPQLSHLHLYASLILFLRGRIFGAALFGDAVVV